MFYHTDTSTHTALCGTKGLKIACTQFPFLKISEQYDPLWITVAANRKYLVQFTHQVLIYHFK